MSASCHQLLDSELDESLGEGCKAGPDELPLDVSEELGCEEDGPDGPLEAMDDEGRDDELPELLLGDGLPELLEDDDGVANEELLLDGLNDELELLDELLLDASDSDELDEPLDDGERDEDELEESLEKELDNGVPADEPEELGLDDELLPDPLDELEQWWQQQQPAWWLKVHGPSCRVSDPLERQMETARV